MRNITKDEFQKICEELYSKTRKNLFAHTEEELSKMGDDDPLYVNKLLTTLTLNAFDLSCRYSQELFESLFFEDNSDK